MGDLPTHMDVVMIAYTLGLDPAVLSTLVDDGHAPDPTFWTPERYDEHSDEWNESEPTWSVATIPAWLRALDSIGIEAPNCRNYPPLKPQEEAA
jgi:hypothetical protein